MELSPPRHHVNLYSSCWWIIIIHASFPIMIVHRWFIPCHLQILLVNIQNNENNDIDDELFGCRVGFMWWKEGKKRCGRWSFGVIFFSSWALCMCVSCVMWTPHTSGGVTWTWNLTSYTWIKNRPILCDLSHAIFEVMVRPKSVVFFWRHILSKKEAKYIQIEKLQNHVSEKVLQGVTKCYKYFCRKNCTWNQY